MSVERKMVKTVVDGISTGSLEGSLKDALETIQNCIDMHGENAVLDWGQHYSYDETYSFGVVVEKIETDEQFALRLANEERARVRQLENFQSAAKQLGYDITKKVA